MERKRSKRMQICTYSSRPTTTDQPSCPWLTVPAAELPSDPLTVYRDSLYKQHFPLILHTVGERIRRISPVQDLTSNRVHVKSHTFKELRIEGCKPEGRCARKILATEQDFREQKGRLQEEIEARGHKVIFHPKSLKDYVKLFLEL